jgi:hypothetical protein
MSKARTRFPFEYPVEARTGLEARKVNPRYAVTAAFGQNASEGRLTVGQSKTIHSQAIGAGCVFAVGVDEYGSQQALAQLLAATRCVATKRIVDEQDSSKRRMVALPESQFSIYATSMYNPNPVI